MRLLLVLCLFLVKAITDRGLISPLLGNIYLNELHLFVARKYETLAQYPRTRHPYGCFICRYADDFVILVRGTRENPEALKAEVADFLRNQLRLELSVETTLVTHVDEGFDFLGFHIRRYERNGKKVALTQPSEKAQMKFGGCIRELTRNVSRIGGCLWIVDLNRYLSGWAEYFRRGNSRRTFSKLDHILWWMISLRMRGRWRRFRMNCGFRAFLRQQLFPCRFDIQYPHYRRYIAKNFSHWVDDGKTAALIVDRLSYYPIQYVPCFTQVHPYAPQGRAKVEAIRKAGRLVTNAWRVAPPEKTKGRLVYGLLQHWLAQRGSRCSSCGKDLDRIDARELVERLVGRLRDAQKPMVALQCRTCFRPGKD